MSISVHLVLVLGTLLALFFISSNAREAGKIAVYWGQDARENHLTHACSQRYGIVIVSYLSQFGGGREPRLSLDKYHCNLEYPDIGCKYNYLSVKDCQEKGVKVLLSIGGHPGNYSLSSDEDARNVADYLWNNFLGGNGNVSSDPLGNAVFDGIDLDIRGGQKHYAELVRRLAGYSTADRKVYITASTPCLFPSKRLGEAFNTGLIDYAWIKFYNAYTSQKQCEYNPENVNAYKKSWESWTSMHVKTKFFFGTLAHPAAADSGYIYENVLTSEILPFIKKSANYGGVMIWDGYYEYTFQYSNAILNSV